jgi:hypothetical protein
MCHRRYDNPSIRIQAFNRRRRASASFYKKKLLVPIFHKIGTYLKEFAAFVQPHPSLHLPLNEVLVPCLDCRGNTAVVVKTASPISVSNFSISLWFYPRSWNQNYCGLVCSDPYKISLHGCGSAYVTGSAHRPPRMNGHASFYVVPDGRSRSPSDPEMFVPVPEMRRWHFLCVSFRGNFMHVCLDGVKKMQAWTQPVPAFKSTVSTLVLGSVFPKPKPGHHFDGCISSVSAFSPSLFDVHVDTMFRQGPSYSPSIKNLVGHWPLKTDCNRSDGTPPISTSSVHMGFA